MLKPEVIAEVRRLLQAQPPLSHRAIARQTGVSRATIGQVASGRRPDYPLPSRVDDEIRFEGPPERCRTCGGLVYMPCRLCFIRALQAKEDERRRLRRDNPFAPPPAPRRERVGEPIAGGAAGRGAL